MAVAIGRDNQATSNQNYCQPGIMATADDATWGEISGFKRSVTFYKREAGQWCYYCQFSMTSDTASYEPTVRTLLDNDDICAGRSSISTSTRLTTYPSNMPAGDTIFQAAYLANQGGDLIMGTQRACVNMRTQPSMSTACIEIAADGAATTAATTTATTYFPVSVCCTHDYCAMRDGTVRFTYLAHADSYFLLREGKAVALLAPPSSSLSSCEALTSREEGRYHPLLRHGAVEAACAPDSDSPAPTLSDGAANATTAVPAPADEVFSRAALGLRGHSALVAATQAWCANMRSTRSIATACMVLPTASTPASASAASAGVEAWVPLSVCCSSDLCEIRRGGGISQEGATAAAEAFSHLPFSHAALDDGAGGLEHFLLKAGRTVQAIGAAPSSSAGQCEAAVRASNLLPATPYYPLLDTAAVDIICALPPPPPPPIAKLTGEKKNQVSVQVTASGVVSDYDATKIAAVECAMATVAAVACNAVTVTVTAGSVLLDFIIITTDPAAVQAIVTETLATTAGATTALGVTVETVPTVAVVLPAASDALDTGAIAGIVVGSVAGGLLLLLLLLAAFCMCRGGRRPSDKSASPAGKAPV